MEFGDLVVGRQSSREDRDSVEGSPLSKDSEVGGEADGEPSGSGAGPQRTGSVLSGLANDIQSMVSQYRTSKSGGTDAGSPMDKSSVRDLYSQGKGDSKQRRWDSQFNKEFRLDPKYGHTAAGKRPSVTRGVVEGSGDHLRQLDPWKVNSSPRSKKPTQAGYKSLAFMRGGSLDRSRSPSPEDTKAGRASAHAISEGDFAAHMKQSFGKHWDDEKFSSGPIRLAHEDLDRFLEYKKLMQDPQPDGSRRHAGRLMAEVDAEAAAGRYLLLPEDNPDFSNHFTLKTRPLKSFTHGERLEDSMNHLFNVGPEGPKHNLPKGKRPPLGEGNEDHREKKHYNAWHLKSELSGGGGHLVGYCEEDEISYEYDCNLLIDTSFGI